MPTKLWLAGQFIPIHDLSVNSFPGIGSTALSDDVDGNFLYTAALVADSSMFSAYILNSTTNASVQASQSEPGALFQRFFTSEIINEEVTLSGSVLQNASVYESDAKLNVGIRFVIHAVRPDGTNSVISDTYHSNEMDTTASERQWENTAITTTTLYPGDVIQLAAYATPLATTEAGLCYLRYGAYTGTLYNSWIEFDQDIVFGSVGKFKEIGTTLSGLGAIGFDGTTYAYSQSGGAIWTATDPYGTWTQRSSGITDTVYSIAYGNEVWCAVGNNASVWTTTDPTGTWTDNTNTLGTLVGTETISHVTYANGYFFAVSTLTNSIWLWASDPTGSWSSSTIASFLAERVGYTNGYWWVGGRDANRGQVMYTTSLSGTPSWSNVAMPIVAASHYVHGIVWDGTYYWSVGSGTSTSNVQGWSRSTSFTSGWTSYGSTSNPASYEQMALIPVMGDKFVYAEGDAYNVGATGNSFITIPRKDVSFFADYNEYFIQDSGWYHGARDYGVFQLLDDGSNLIQAYNHGIWIAPYENLENYTVGFLNTENSSISGGKVLSDKPSSSATQYTTSVSAGTGLIPLTVSAGGADLLFYSGKLKAGSMVGQFSSVFAVSTLNSYVNSVAKLYVTDGDGSNPVLIGSSRHGRGHTEGSWSNGQRLLVKLYGGGLLENSSGVRFSGTGSLTCGGTTGAFITFPALLQYLGGAYWGMRI